MNENCACSGCVPPLPGDGNPDNPWCTLNEAKDILGSSGKYMLEKNPIRTAEQDGVFYYRKIDIDDLKESTKRLTVEDVIKSLMDADTNQKIVIDDGSEEDYRYISSIRDQGDRVVIKVEKE